MHACMHADIEMVKISHANCHNNNNRDIGYLRLPFFLITRLKNKNYMIT